MLFRTLCISLIMTACVEDVAKDKAKAEIISSTQTDEGKTEQTQDPAKEQKVTSTKTLKVDPARSSFSALSAKITATHPIQFPEFTGTITADQEELTGLAFEIDMTKLQADHPRLTEHLLNEDFFNVSKFPTSTFKSSKVQAELGEQGTTHMVTGDMTICGTTKTIKFPATITSTADSFSATSGFAINRQDFGVSYKGKADDLIQDNVALTLQFVAAR